MGQRTGKESTGQWTRTVRVWARQAMRSRVLLPRVLAGLLPRVLAGLLPGVLAGLLLAACAPTAHQAQRDGTSRPVGWAQMEAMLDMPGPVELETVASASAVSDLDGLLNLNHPAARSAGLRNRDEPIQIFLHVLKHPDRGVYLVDTGVAKALMQKPEDWGLNAFLRRGMKFERIVLSRSSGEVLQGLGQPVQGVLLTHLHLDHISGLPDLPLDLPIYAGPGENTEWHWTNLLVRGASDTLLKGRPPLRAWPFEAARGQDPLSVLDVFGDGSVFALHVPGHTAGSTAYLVRTRRGPVLLTGDACHTRWGWEHDVEPGHFTRDPAPGVRSLQALKSLAARHPALQVRLGHQS